MIFHVRKGRILQYLLFLLMICLLTTCKKEDAAIKEYPRINTLDVSGINESGATFGANIISGDLTQTKEYGFVWDISTSPDINLHDKLVMTGILSNKSISGIVHSALKKDVVYYMRAYVKTDKYLVYGKVVSFKSLGSEAPVIADFSPKSASWNDTIKITGKNFRYRTSGIVVKLGELATTIISSTDTTIRFVIPAKINYEKVNVSVSIEGNISVSTTPFSYLIPSIADISPLLATFNDTIYIRGTNFFKSIVGNKVYFNGLTATIVYASRSLLKVLVPATLTLNQAKISISGPVKDIEFGSLFSLKAIVLKSFEPDTIFHPSGIITIKGENFNPLLINNAVIINGFKATIVESTFGYLKVKLPDEVIPDRYLSVFTNADIAVNVGEQKAKFNKNIEVSWKSRWTKKKNFPGIPRGQATGFSIGNKGYYGLGCSINNSVSECYSDLWEYAQFTDTWIRKSDFPGDGRNSGSTFVLDGEGYVGLGAGFTGFYKDIYKYNPLSDAWTKISDFGGIPRLFSASFIKNGLAYVGTGHIESGNSIATNDFWSYNPQIDQWNKVLDFPYQTQTAVGLSIGNAGYVYDSGKIREFKETLWQDIAASTLISIYGSEVAFTIGSKGYIVPYLGWYTFLLEFDSNNKQINKMSVPNEVLCTEATIFTVEKKAYVLCGRLQNTFIRNVWEFDPSLPND